MQENLHYSVNGSNVEEIQGSVILFMFIILEIKRFQHIDIILSNEIMNIDVDPQKLKGLSNGIMDIDDNVDIVKWLSKFERIQNLWYHWLSILRGIVKSN